MMNGLGQRNTAIRRVTRGTATALGDDVRDVHADVVEPPQDCILQAERRVLRQVRAADLGLGLDVAPVQRRFSAECGNCRWIRRWLTGYQQGERGDGVFRGAAGQWLGTGHDFGIFQVQDRAMSMMVAASHESPLHCHSVGVWVVRDPGPDGFDVGSQSFGGTS